MLIKGLPDDVVVIIFSFITDLKTIAKASAVSRGWHDELTRNNLWELKLWETFESSSHILTPGVRLCGEVSKNNPIPISPYYTPEIIKQLEELFISKKITPKEYLINFILPCHSCYLHSTIKLEENINEISNLFKEKKEGERVFMQGYGDYLKLAKKNLFRDNLENYVKKKKYYLSIDRSSQRISILNGYENSEEQLNDIEEVEKKIDGEWKDWDFSPYGGAIGGHNGSFNIVNRHGFYSYHSYSQSRPFLSLITRTSVFPNVGDNVHQWLNKRIFDTLTEQSEKNEIIFKRYPFSSSDIDEKLTELELNRIRESKFPLIPPHIPILTCFH